MIVDADGAIAGRLATKIAKELLKGQSVIIINAEKAVITGNPDAIINRYKIKTERGDPNKGPFYPRQPDKLLRRVIRGMLPYKRPKGGAAFRRLQVFNGNPNNLKGEKMSKTIDDIECKYLTLKALGNKLGARVD